MVDSAHSSRPETNTTHPMQSELPGNPYEAVGLKKKVAIITGATSMIGFATAKLMARRGAHVVLAGRNEQKGNEMVKAIKSADGDAIFVTTDVTNQQSVHSLVQQAVSKYGHIDILFLNQGVCADECEAHSQDESDLDKQIAVHFKGAHYVLQAVIKQLENQVAKDYDSVENSVHKLDQQAQHNPNDLYKSAQPYAIVINSSISGVFGSAGAYGFTATKHALLGMAKSAAAKYASHGIRVNAIAPGFVWSDMTEEKGNTDHIRKSTPSRRLGQPEEIAQLAAFLSSTACPFLVGQTLVVDGGYSAAF